MTDLIFRNLDQAVADLKNEIAQEIFEKSQENILENETSDTGFLLSSVS